METTHVFPSLIFRSQVFLPVFFFYNLGPSSVSWHSSIVKFHIYNVSSRLAPSFVVLQERYDVLLQNRNLQLVVFTWTDADTEEKDRVPAP